jgi:hypothetical protein
MLAEVAYRPKGGIVYCLLTLLATVVGFVSCNQVVHLPASGTPEESIRTRFGEPTRIEKILERPLNRTFTYFGACRQQDRITTVWVYEAHLRAELLIAFDASRQVVCSAHGAVTFIH